MPTMLYVHRNVSTVYYVSCLFTLTGWLMVGRCLLMQCIIYTMGTSRLCTCSLHTYATHLYGFRLDCMWLLNAFSRKSVWIDIEYKHDSLSACRGQHVEALYHNARRQTSYSNNSYGKKPHAITAAACMRWKRAWLCLTAHTNRAHCLF